MQEWMAWCLQHHLSRDDDDDDGGAGDAYSRDVVNVTSSTNTIAAANLARSRDLKRQLSYDSYYATSAHAQPHNGSSARRCVLRTTQSCQDDDDDDTSTSYYVDGTTMRRRAQLQRQKSFDIKPHHLRAPAAASSAQQQLGFEGSNLLSLRGHSQGLSSFESSSTNDELAAVSYQNSFEST